MNATLPRLHLGELDSDACAALFEDLAALTEIEAVLIKGSATAYAGASALDEARRALAAGAHGVSIRYRWDRRAWIDTILRTPAGLRIVRACIDPPGSSHDYEG